MNFASTLEFRPMGRADAEEVSGWRYPDEYAMYDPASNDSEDSIGYMADPVNGFFGARDGSELIGFCSIGPDGRVPGWDYDDSAVDVGAGMRPVLIGQGDGSAFLRQAVRFAQKRVGRRGLRATIASWNARALAAAKGVGFELVGSFERDDGMVFAVLVRREDDQGVSP